MTAYEELEYICNAAYLRGCGSNFKTAIAGMQENENARLAWSKVNICESGKIYYEFDYSTERLAVEVVIRGALGSYDAEVAIESAIADEETARIAVLAKMIIGDSDSN